MLFVYNILQILLLVLFWPLLLLFVLAKKKYRSRIPSRLGFGLSSKTAGVTKGPTFWVHALSVGEVTSALPLVTAIRNAWPESRITFTATTLSGNAIAEELLGDRVDCIVPAPLDILPVARHYIKTIAPDAYIHVETDFWPNLLHCLDTAGIPSLLVNGRISQASFQSYSKYSFFFTPMFRNFSSLCLQTRQDKTYMMQLGLPEEKLHTLGNLKFDTPAGEKSKKDDVKKYLPANKPVFVAGSTHPGEEEIVIGAAIKVRQQFPELFLVIVPRNIDRAEEIEAQANQYGLTASLRTQQPEEQADLLIVNTIGELIDFYRYSTVAFVGGSLVTAGGHNPIEPALFGVPVLFGPHMEDFSEIATSLLQAEGGLTVGDENQLADAMNRFLENEPARRQVGNNARAFVDEQRGVISRHIELLQQLL